MQQVDFTLTTDIRAVVPASIDFNYEELKQWLTANLENYRTLVVTEEQMAAAKADRAKINKISKAISDQRIAIKKQYLAPFNEFESQCKELSGLCDAASKNLADQINAIEEARKAEKMSALKTFFEEFISGREAADFLTWEDVVNPRWANSTFTEDAAKEEITKAVVLCDNDIVIIRDMDSDFVPELLNLYSKTHNLGECIKHNRELFERREMEQKRREEQERRAKEIAAAQAAKAAAEAKKEEKPAPAAVTAPEEIFNNPPPAITSKPPVRVIDFRIWATNSQLQALKAFLIENGIKYGRVQ